MPQVEGQKQAVYVGGKLVGKTRDVCIGPMEYGVVIINPRMRKADPHRAITVKFEAVSESDARRQAEEKCRQHGFIVGKCKRMIPEDETRAAIRHNRRFPL